MWLVNRNQKKTDGVYFLKVGLPLALWLILLPFNAGAETSPLIPLEVSPTLTSRGRRAAQWIFLNFYCGISFQRCWGTLSTETTQVEFNFIHPWSISLFISKILTVQCMSKSSPFSTEELNIVCCKNVDLDMTTVSSRVSSLNYLNKISNDYLLLFWRPWLFGHIKHQFQPKTTWKILFEAALLWRAWRRK